MHPCSKNHPFTTNQPTKKVCDENERNKQTRKKRRERKNYIHGRKPFITPMWRTSENDLHEPWGDDNEGTICLVSGLAGACMNSGSFLFLCIHCHTIFSLKKTLECVCERLLHCRLISAITWTPDKWFA